MNKITANLKCVFTLLLLAVTLAFSNTGIQAQSNGVDSSFNAVPSRNTFNSTFFLQPDGKILLFGDFQVVNGNLRNKLARLNANGDLDSSFQCSSCNFSIGNILVQPDGKILIAGEGQVRRLNGDGSLDNSFNYTRPSAASYPSLGAIQPDGKILILNFASIPFNYQFSIYRLNADGTNDTAFSTINFAAGNNSYETVKKIVLLPSGDIITSTYNVSSGGGGNISRFSSNGNRDTNFESPTFDGTLGTPARYLVNDIKLFSDGSLLVVGDFTSVNGISRQNIVKLLPAGNVDLNFVTPNVFQTYEPATEAAVYSNGKFLVSTGIVRNPIGPSGTTNRFILFNADGSVDNSFVSPSNLVTVKHFDIDNTGSALVLGAFTINGITSNRLARLNANGTVNSYLNLSYGIGSSITTLGLQPDGKILLAGNFDQINGAPRNIVARVNPDGSFDSTFSFGGITNSDILEIVVQPDGKILLTGSFTVNNTSNIGAIRLNSDGSVDTTFGANLDGIRAIALQADGKILVGVYNAVLRLNSDGTRDTSFNTPVANSGGNSSFIYELLITTDGKIMVGGSFTAIGGFTRKNLARLNADGSVDSTFNAGDLGGETYNRVIQIKQLPDGKYIFLGDQKIVRLNNNGSQDTSFQTAVSNGTNAGFSVASDGSIIIAGNFSSVNNIARANITRLIPNGTIDTAFFPNGANGQIRSVITQTDGKILVGGNFSVIGDVQRLSIARILNTVSTARTPFDFDGDGRADVSVFRPSTGFWYTSQNPAVNYGAIQFGISTDKLVPADYDGDGKSDVAVVRNGTWYLQRSQLGFTGITFGLGTDIPVPADYDGDGKADIAVFRPSNGTWYLNRSSLGYTAIALGLGTDIPVPADYDGDGKAEAAVFRPSNGFWYNSTNPATNYGGVQFGAAEDKPVPADYDGDGKVDRAVFRPGNGTWYLLQSTAGFTGLTFGFGTDLPTAADYDGDGKADVAVFRQGNWYLNRSTQGFTGIQFGLGDDKPIPNSFVR